MRTITIAATTLALATLTACRESHSAEQATPADFILTSAPEGAVEVTAAKATATEGDPITLTATIGGRAQPITTDSAAFTVMDNAIPSCIAMEGKGCPTPWDYCCETAKSRTQHSATIQLVDADGNPLNADPVAAGLEPLDTITVVGTVGPRPTSDVLVVHATAVYIANN